MIAEQNWFAKNMEHRDTKAQSFYFLREQSLWRNGLLYGLCLLLIYFLFISPWFCASVFNKKSYEFLCNSFLIDYNVFLD